jgi:ribonuclease HII
MKATAAVRRESVSCSTALTTTLVAGRRIRLLTKRPRGMALDSPNLVEEIARLERLSEPVQEVYRRHAAGQVDGDKVVLVAGCDEVGVGCLAGPVVAAAVVLSPGVSLFEALNDSKKLTIARREDIFASLQICDSVFIGVGEVDAKTVDVINVRQARMLAMRRAVDSLCMQTQPSHLFIDGTEIIGGDCIPSEQQTYIVGGDAICDAIAAGSIVAKVTRDAMMQLAHAQYPEYAFNTNKGYGSRVHLDALKKYGPTPLHRLSYEPVHRAMDVGGLR